MELNSDRGKNIHFVVRLCSDAFLEVIYWGDRRKLTSLEKLGKRFHLLIDGWFEEVPFLRLDLRIRPLSHSISIRFSKKEICQVDLLTISPFVRFNIVNLHYDYHRTPIKLKESCEWIQTILQPLKPALKGAKFEFDDSEHDSMLLSHLEKDLLPICDNCRSYKFRTEFWDHSSANKFISTVLQFCHIDYVLFHFIIYDNFLVDLPVDVIANWLNRNRNSNAIYAKGQMENERILSIEITGVGKVSLGNISEMLKCLKEALHPMQQFAFRTKSVRARADEKIECEEISNAKTGEKLSIVYFANNHMDHTLEIKRSKAEKKKDNKNGDK